MFTHCYSLSDVKTDYPAVNQCCTRNCTEFTKYLYTESAQNTKSQGQSNVKCPLAQHASSAPLALCLGLISRTISLAERVEKLQGHHWSDNTPGTYLSLFPLHQQNLYSSPSWLYPLHFRIQAPLFLSIALKPVRHACHRDDRDAGSQTLIDDALPKEAEASNKDDLKTWFMCVW